MCVPSFPTQFSLTVFVFQVAIKTFKDRLDKMKSLTTQPEVKVCFAPELHPTLRLSQ